ncbi:unnamed protein product, partial [Soboliphyme baturini]|uniref:SSD domain-containing protein n=1 Tax=Soboliphyme baturini TaxID=241478 RepID=A0A183J6T1_9BILA
MKKHWIRKFGLKEPFCFNDFVKSFYAHLGTVIARHPIPFLLIPVLMTAASAKSFKPTTASTIDEVDFRFLRHSLVYVIMVDKTSNMNAVSEIGLRYAADLIEQVKAIEVQVFNAHKIEWSSICYKSETGKCLEHPLFDALEKTTANGQVLSVAEQYLYYPTAKVGNLTVDNTMIFGGISKRADNSIAKAEAIRIPFVLKDIRSELDYVLNNAWRNRFLKIIQESYYPGFGVYANTWSSLAHEIQRNGSMLTPYLFYLVLILVVASVLCCCTVDCQASKPWLGFCGLVNAAFAVITATGILFGCRYSYLHMVVIMPFLVMSVSVDNVFLMLNCWRATGNGNLKLEQRVSACVGDTSVSMMISALTDGLSFTVGNITPFPAVRNRPGECFLNVMWCFNFSRWNQIFATFVADALSNKLIRVGTVLLYVTFLASALYGVVNIRFGLNVQNLIPHDSPVSRTVAINEKYFSAYCGYASVVITEPMDIGQETAIKRLLSLYHSLAYSRYSSEGSFWLNNFMAFMESRNRSLNANRYYVRFLHEFFMSPDSRRFADDVQLDSSTLSLIHYMKMTIRLRNCGQENHTKLAALLRRRLGESAVQGFIFEPLFLIVDQNLLVLQTAMQDVIVAVAIMV